MAHLKARGTRGHHRRRQQAKLAIIRMLYKRGYSPQDAKQLLRFIDWLLTLPKKELEPCLT